MAHENQFLAPRREFVHKELACHCEDVTHPSHLRVPLWCGLGTSGCSEVTVNTTLHDIENLVHFKFTVQQGEVLFLPTGLCSFNYDQFLGSEKPGCGPD